MSFQKSILSATRPVRYSINSFIFDKFSDKTELLKLKGIHSNKPMLVVGNGPSLNKTPLSKFSTIPSIGMNKIDMIFNRTDWRPEVIVCLNNVVAMQHQSSFATCEIPVFVAWKSRLLMHGENRKLLQYYNLQASNRFSGDPVSGFGSSATVTYIALQMAYWMGADPVVLFGIDHSFKFEGPISSYQYQKGMDPNHFDKNYFSPGSLWGTPDLVQSEADYRLARDAFQRDGRTILDATVGGQLEIFKKISLTEACDVLL